MKWILNNVTSWLRTDRPSASRSKHSDKLKRVGYRKDAHGSHHAHGIAPTRPSATQQGYALGSFPHVETFGTHTRIRICLAGRWRVWVLFHLAWASSPAKSAASPPAMTHVSPSASTRRNHEPQDRHLRYHPARRRAVARRQHEHRGKTHHRPPAGAHEGRRHRGGLSHFKPGRLQERPGDRSHRRRRLHRLRPHPRASIAISRSRQRRCARQSARVSTRVWACPPAICATSSA